MLLGNSDRSKARILFRPTDPAWSPIHLAMPDSQTAGFCLPVRFLDWWGRSIARMATIVDIMCAHIEVPG